MYILGKDLKGFRKKHKISMNDTWLPSHAVYSIESKEYKAPYYGRLLDLLNSYMYLLRKHESITLESSPVPLSKLYELGQLDRKLDTIDQEISEINMEIQKLLDKANELHDKVNELKIMKGQLKNEISTGEENLGLEQSSIFDSLKKEGIELSGSGTKVLSPYKLESGIYTVSTELAKEPVSFVILYEQLDREYFSLRIVEGESFEIKEKGYYLFYVFASDDLEWRTKIKKATGIEEILGSDIEILELDRYTLRSLYEMRIRKVKDLTDITIQSLMPEIDQTEIQNALGSLGLSMKQIQKSNLVQSPELLTSKEVFSTRTYNCLESVGIHTVEQLIKFSEEEIFKIRKLGRRSLLEITTRLEELGLSLRNNSEPWIYTNTKSEELRDVNNNHNVPNEKREVL